MTHLTGKGLSIPMIETSLTMTRTRSNEASWIGGRRPRRSFWGECGTKHGASLR
jgi:hypothetical protein